MAPPKKKAKTTQNEERPTPSAILADNRARWLLKNDAQSVELNVKGETLVVHKHVLTNNSEYFNKCFEEPWAESRACSVTFDDIEPKYVALFIGVAYSHTSLVVPQPPQSSKDPQASGQRTPLKDLVEVYKLCDRFVAERMGKYMVKCILVSIGDGHRALFRSPSDEGQQKLVMRDFADGYEALELLHSVQKEIGAKMIEYFCGGVSYSTWASCMDEISDRPKFVGSVSKGFANRLGELQLTRKLKRKEMNGPGDIEKSG